MTEVSPLADAVRPFWLAGLNEISGNCKKEIKAWINDEEFQVYVAPTESSFTLGVSDSQSLLRAFAAEISRTSMASNETMASVLVPPAAKKSTAWLIIQTYYAAFFAAHSLIRLFGTSCLPIDPLQLRSITKISKLFGQEPGGPLGGGLYRMDFDPTKKELRASQIKSMKAGPHEAFWKLFTEVVERISTGMLNQPFLTAATVQPAAGKLSELVANLSFNNCGRGAWLSSVRNSVNYEQRWATWYPYSQRQAYYDQLFRYTNEWEADPIEIDLTSHENRDLRRFQATCNFIMALARSTATDMAQRCGAGKSFHDFGMLAFRRLFRRVP